MTDIVTARNLRVEIDGQALLHSVNVSVRAGEFLAVLGPNGSGKSTMVKALVGLVPSRGEVSLFGTALASFKDRERIGYLPQHSDQASGVPSTVTEVVMSGTLARHRWFGWPTRAERAEVHAVIDRVGLRQFANRPLNELSGGQRQRALIARALVGEPDLLVMDEPTVGVDVESLEVLATILREELDDQTAVIMVAHELGPLRTLVNRTIRLADGRIVYDGPPELTGHLVDDHHAHPNNPPIIAPVVTEGPLQ